MDQEQKSDVAAQTRAGRGRPFPSVDERTLPRFTMHHTRQATWWTDGEDDLAYFRGRVEGEWCNPCWKHQEWFFKSKTDEFVNGPESEWTRPTMRKDDDL